MRFMLPCKANWYLTINMDLPLAVCAKPLFFQSVLLAVLPLYISLTWVWPILWQTILQGPQKKTRSCSRKWGIGRAWTSRHQGDHSSGSVWWRASLHAPRPCLRWRCPPSGEFDLRFAHYYLSFLDTLYQDGEKSPPPLNFGTTKESAFLTNANKSAIVNQPDRACRPVGF